MITFAYLFLLLMALVCVFVITAGFLFCVLYSIKLVIRENEDAAASKEEQW